jgi:hypothetical protein
MCIASRKTTLAAGMVLALTTAAPAPAVTVRGALTYAGEPILSSFAPGDFASQSLRLFDSSWALVAEGSIDLAGSTYEITGVPAGTYTLWLLLSPDTGVEAGSFPRSRELWTRDSNVVVGETDPLELDLALSYAVRLTSPYDSLATWPGDTWSCPFGAPVAKVFTLAWDPVPRATRYEVTVERWACPWRQLTDSTYHPAGTSVEITQQEVPDETQVLVRTVSAFDSHGNSLSRLPWLSYENGGSTGTYLRMARPEERLAHSTFGRLIPQVARVPGVGTSYWTSTLTLTNPTLLDVEATLYFTAREANGMSAYREATVTVPRNACRTYHDVLPALFATSSAGAVEVYSADLIVASRTSTPGDSGGTYGQGYLPVPPDALASLSGTPTLRGGGVVKGAFRTNLTLNEAWGESVVVLVELLDRDGGVLGQKQVSLQAYGNTQINDVVAKLSSRNALTEGQVRVTVLSGRGRVAGTLSVVDNATDDPTTIPLLPR